MSLKNIILKSITTFIAISLFFSNISICGMGIKSVIAENSNVPAIEIELENEKYVQYMKVVEEIKEEQSEQPEIEGEQEEQLVEKREIKTVALQSKLSIYPNYSEEGYLPTKNVEASIYLPRINGYMPEEAIILTSKTLSTTGEEVNNKINQSYDKNSGLLVIAYENIENEEGQIYSEYKENVKDEFEIIYTYPAESYSGNEEEIKLTYIVKAKTTFITENATITLQNAKSIDLIEKENKKDVATLDITKLNGKIYKGAMYSNVENKAEYETEYETEAELVILNNTVVEELEIGLKESTIVLDNEEEIVANGNIEYKSTGIRREDFNNILGVNGSIEFYQNENKCATVKYIEITEEKETVKKLAVIYSEENVKIITDEEEIITVDYAEGITEVKIKISQPEAEGKIRIYNKNKIKASSDYGVQVEKIKQIKTQTYANSYEGSRKIALLEPETKIDMNLSTTSFSTLQAANIQATVKLDSTNLSTKLFNNPIIKVILPEGIETGRISSLEIINGNGLEIDREKSRTDKNIITIQLKGKQTQYDLNNVSGGASIVFDIDNLKYKSTLAAHTDKVEVECIQGEENIKKNIDVEIVSRYGLLMHSVTKGYNSENSITTNIDSSIKEISISEREDKKEIEQTLTLVNNYGEDLTNVEIIGQLGYTNTELISTFETKLTKGIEVNKEGTKVYYTENKEANIDDESWTEEYTSNAKLYKIVLENNKISKEETVEIRIKAEVPANLGYNQKAYLRTQANYICGEKYLEDSTTIGILTQVNDLYKNTDTTIMQITNEEEKQIPIKITITPNITQEYVHSGQVVTYKIKVQNESDKELNDIVVQDIIPENAIYTYVDEKEGNIANYNELVQDINLKLKEWNIKSLNTGDIAEFEIMLTMSETEEEQEVINKIKLVCSDKEAITENKLILKPAKANINLTTDSDNILNVIYNVGDIVKYQVNIQNISQEKLRNIKVNFRLPDTLEYVEGGLATYDPFDGYVVNEKGTINNDIFEYNVDKLKEQEEIIINITARINQLIQGTECNIDTVAQVDINGEIYETNMKTITTKQAKFTIRQSANNSENNVLKHKDQIVYTIEIENIGIADGSMVLKDNIPEQLNTKKIEEYINNELKEEYEITRKDIERLISLRPGETYKIKIIAEVDLVYTEEINNNIEVANVADLLLKGIKMASSESKIRIQPELKSKEESAEPGNGEDNKLVEKPQLETEDNNGPKPEQENKPSLKPQPKPEQEQENKPGLGSEPEPKPEQENKPDLYTISGVVWLDTNKDGKREESEILQQNVVVNLIDMNKGKIALDSSGNIIRTTTNSEGRYVFNNIIKGQYSIAFEIDINKYTVTTYQKEGIIQNLNSDAILENTNINEEKKLVAITDKIDLNSNKENIDVGLVENAVFDLELDKSITKITVINDQGTQTTEFKNGDTAKVDLVAKYMAGSEVIVTYRFTVKNKGEVTGYIDSLVDNLPSGLSFNSELNPKWYKGTDGNLYTTSLSGIAIKPGESTQVELVLTKTMTEDNAGTFPNSAKLEKISNLENISEKEDAKQNNESSAILFISIKTGSIILYIGITIMCIVIIAIGAYFIKKKILNRGI